MVDIRLVENQGGRRGELEQRGEEVPEALPVPLPVGQVELTAGDPSGLEFVEEGACAHSRLWHADIALAEKRDPVMPECHQTTGRLGDCLLLVWRRTGDRQPTVVPKQGEGEYLLPGEPLQHLTRGGADHPGICRCSLHQAGDATKVHPEFE